MANPETVNHIAIPYLISKVVNGLRADIHRYSKPRTTPAHTKRLLAHQQQPPKPVPHLPTARNLPVGGITVGSNPSTPGADVGPSLKSKKLKKNTRKNGAKLLAGS